MITSWLMCRWTALTALEEFHAPRIRAFRYARTLEGAIIFPGGLVAWWPGGLVVSLKGPQVNMRILRAFVLMPLLSAVLVSLALISFAGKALAEDIAPTPLNEERRTEFDLSQGHPDFILWDKRLIASGDYNAPVNKDWSNGTLLCQSETDPSVGACPTKDVRSYVNSTDKVTEVRLTFVERRSRAMHEVILVARKARSLIGQLQTPLNEETGAEDSKNLVLDARIPASELKKFPSGGIWDAHWKLRVYRRDRGFVSEVNLKIKLTITDTKNVQIFLPEHHTTTPTVDLGLTGQVSRDGRTTGRRNIDMCLYDGFGAHSSRFDVTIKDGLTVPQRAPGNFSVIRDGTSGQSPRERIDYRVTYVHNGQRKTFINGETVSLPGGDNAEVRSVYLPNIPVPVMCKPMPLTLETPEFNAKEKSAGSYTGKLKIIFSPSAQSL